jgi:RsmE family RNA methyltransferase
MRSPGPLLNVNIILFLPQDVELPLSRRDPRAVHLLNVLRRHPGDTFDAGLVNGPRGKGTLIAIGEEALTLSFVWSEPPPSLCPIHLLIGLPRPQTARDILRDATTLGVAAIHFIRTEKGEASYASSALWQSEQWRTLVLSGAAQAFCTRLPEVTQGRPLADIIGVLPGEATKFALDNYEAPVRLSQCALDSSKPVALALGAERGWSAGERSLLRNSGFVFAHLGTRVLRIETACIAAVTLLKAKLGSL